MEKSQVIIIKKNCYNYVLYKINNIICIPT